MSEAGFVDVHGGRLYYEVEGEGHPLTFIHAGVANLRQWDPHLAAFAERHRVIRYDTRGFGLTTTEDVSYSNRDDLAALLDHLGVRSTFLVGASRGGTIAVDFTLERPGRVDALVAVAAGLSGWQAPSAPEEQAFWDDLERRWEARDWESLTDAETAVWVDGPAQPTDRVPPELRERVRGWIAASYRDHGHEDPQPQPLDPPAAGRLTQIDVPTLVAIGDLDERGTQAACRRLAAMIPAARLEVFEGAAHMLNLEQPDRFSAVVLRFLGEVLGSRAAG